MICKNTRREAVKFATRITALASLGSVLVSCGPDQPSSAEDPVATASEQTRGQFGGSTDIGSVSIPGSTEYNATTGIYRLTASGENMWGARDDFHFSWNKMDGDVFISSKIAFEDKSDHVHRKAGVMIRSSLDADAVYADVVVHAGDGLTSLQYRDEKGGETREIVAPITYASAVRLEKEGDYVFMSWAGEDGVWHSGGSVRLAFGDEYYVGLALTSHDNSAIESAQFSDLMITPLDLAPVTETGYGATVDSTLETIDIATGNRRIVHISKDKFEAPNWSRDGSFLLYNAQGKIYRLPVEGGEPVQVNTGPYEKNNNDHGISPDGTQLIISDQSGDDNQSRIYILPIKGSDSPTPVVDHPSAPSYWHGWSPDGMTVAYTAQRPEVSSAYNIWTKRLDGSDEVRLTDTEGLDDGADYAPDGEWIYYNSTRSGAMQLWKIRPDGTDATQLTFDESFRDWFPHPSPDGKTLVMISFGLDVDVTDHPPNRDVWLRTMPADGSAEPKILTQLFGGQGTINVPSWSPDGSRVAFVSYRLDRDDRPE